MSTNLHGNVGTDSTVASVITFGPPPAAITVNISGTGSARVAINGVAANPTTDSVVDSGFPALLTWPYPPGFSQVAVYSNASETGLTYSISIAKPQGR